LNYKDTLLKAIAAAGELIRTHFNGPFSIEHKEGVNNLVTEIDRLAEEAIICIIQADFPDHSIMGEEGGAQDKGGEYQWIIDPIDGTVNFAHGIPLCCVSIGLKKGGKMLLGAVYNPMMNELFFAEQGKGAFLNDQPIRVSAKSDFSHACLVTGFPYQWPDTAEHPIKTFERLVLQGLPVRRLGSAAIDLCWVACGRFDGFWEYNLNAWDVAAGYLIVTEAGGKVTDFDGNPYDVYGRQTLATNGLIHEDLRRAINAGTK
jgi:myo-inositol-1(or 4)-monophosphatase